MQYRGLHNWVERQLGKPMICWRCKDTSKSRYCWSNNSGEYKKDVNDWERLCYPCHQKKDGWGGTKREFCRRGHKMEAPNLYVKPSTGLRECKACKKLVHSKEWLKSKRKEQV